MIPIYKPLIKKYKTSAINAIESEWISNHGIYVELASEKLKEIINAKYVILMNNGTAATHCLYLSLKFKYPNIKKIYIPNNVFIAPWNCGLYEYKKNMFEVMKMNENTLNIDTSTDYILSLDKNAAVVIVHNYGNIINVPRLKTIRPDLIFIEDNCEGLFGKYNDIYTGGYDGLLASAISFYGNKTLTTGEGGAFITNNTDVYKYIKKVYSHGMTNVRYKHDIIGFNYRMTNIQAGFLYDQLNDLKYILAQKKRIFDRYTTYLQDNIKKNKIKIMSSEEGTIKANWIYNIIVKDIEYSELEKYMLEKQVQIRPFFFPISSHNHLKNIKNEYETDFLKNIRKFGVMLPSFPELDDKKIRYISLCINEYLI